MLRILFVKLAIDVVLLQHQQRVVLADFDGMTMFIVSLSLGTTLTTILVLAQLFGILILTCQ